MMTLQKEASSYKAQRSGFSFLQSFDDDADEKRQAVELLKQEQERLKKIQQEQKELQAKDSGFKQGYDKAVTEIEGTYTQQLQQVNKNNSVEVQKVLAELQKSKQVMTQQVHSLLSSILDQVIPQLYRPVYYSQVVAEIETTLQMLDKRQVVLSANSETLDIIKQQMDEDLVADLTFTEKSDFQDGKINLKWSSGGYDFDINEVLTSVSEIINRHLG